MFFSKLEKWEPKEGSESPRFGATRIVRDGIAPPRKDGAAGARSKTPLLVYQQKIESPYRRKYDAPKRESNLHLGREAGLNVDLPIDHTKSALKTKKSQAVHNSISFIDSSKLVYVKEEKKSIMDATFNQPLSPIHLVQSLDMPCLAKAKEPRNRRAACLLDSRFIEADERSVQK